ncbi:MAG: DUF177 domain-containing protein [Bacillota bacterium]|nr:DUF177 domain-containing protein [Bacillota bacterium]
MLAIDIGKIKNRAGARLDFQLAEPTDAAAYGYDSFRLLEPLTISGTAENNGHTIAVSGEYGSCLELICARCLQPYRLPVKAPLNLFFAARAKLDADGEQDVYPYDGESAPLTPHILAEIYFDLPMQPLCREDCRGICPHCGVDLNQQSCSCAVQQIDSRWEKLRDLIDDTEKGER